MPLPIWTHLQIVDSIATLFVMDNWEEASSAHAVGAALCFHIGCCQSAETSCCRACFKKHVFKLAAIQSVLLVKCCESFKTNTMKCLWQWLDFIAWNPGKAELFHSFFLLPSNIKHESSPKPIQIPCLVFFPLTNAVVPLLPAWWMLCVVQNNIVLVVSGCEQKDKTFASWTTCKQEVKSVQW